MALSERLAFLVTVNGRDAIRGFERLGAAAEKNLGKADARLDKIGHRATVAGAGMLAFAGVAGGALFKFAQASEEAHRSDLLLQNTLSNMPKLAGENAKGFKDLAQSIQSKTAADGDQIVAAEAMLGTFQLTGDEIKKVTPLVVDYAQKFGVDMTNAAIQVGKALDGQVGALKRNGVSIDENLFKTDRFAAVTKALRDQVGGFAEEEGKTFSGRLQRLKNELGDLEEGVGVGVVGAFESAIGPVTSFSRFLGETSPRAQELTGRLLAIGTAGIGAVGGLSLIAGQLIKMRQRFVQLEGPAKGSLNTLGKFAAGAGIAAGLAGVAVTLVEVTKAVHDLKFEVEDLSKLTNDELVRAFDALGHMKFSDGPARQLEVFRKVAESNIGTARRLRDELFAQGKDVSELDKILAHETRGQQQANRDMREGADATEDLGDATDDTADAIGDLNKRIEAQKKALDDLLDATLAQFDADLRYKDAVNGVEDALHDYTEKAMLAAAAGGKNAEANEALERSSDDAAKAFLDQARAAAALAGPTATAGDKAKIQREELEKIRDTLAPDSPLRKRLDEYIFTLATIPRSIKTTIEQDFVGGTPETGRTVHRAHGGPLAAGQVAVVGEQGPEVFVPNVGGKVVPNGAVSKTVSITNNFDMRGVDDPIANADAISRIQGDRLGAAGGL